METTLLVAVMWRYRDRAGLAGAALGYGVAVKLFLWPLVAWLALVGIYSFTRRCLRRRCVDPTRSAQRNKLDNNDLEIDRFFIHDGVHESGVLHETGVRGEDERRVRLGHFPRTRSPDVHSFCGKPCGKPRMTGV